MNANFRATLALLWALGCAAASNTESSVITAPTTAAAVAFTTPLSGALVAGPLVTLRGTAGGVDHVLVNGQPVEVHAGAFVVVLSLPDGAASVVATAGEGASAPATATVSFDVDSKPPALTLATPGRATSVPGGSQINVSFSAYDERGVKSVSIDGQPVAADAQGGGATSVAATPGLSLIRAAAVDTAGLAARETVAVLAGDFAPASEVLADAVVVHLGPSAFAALARAATTLVDGLDVNTFALQQNPFVDTTTVRMDVLSASLEGPTEVSFGLAQDALSASVALNELRLSLRATVTLASEPTVFDIDIAVPRLAATVPVEITTDTSVPSPVFSVTLLDPSFDVVDPVVTVTAQDGTPVPDKGFIQGEVLTTLESLVTSLVTQYGQEPLRAATLALTNPLSVPFGSAPVVVDLEAIEATVAETGLDLRLGGAVFIDGASVVTQDPGVYRTPVAPELVLRSDDLAIALSDDLVNTVLHEAWRRGMLSYRIDQGLLDDAKAELDLVAGFLGSLTGLLGEAVDPESSLGIDLAAGLPPVVQPGGKGLVTLGLGDATLGFVVGAGPGAPLPAQPLGTGFVSAFLSVGVESRGEEVALTLNLVDSAFDLALGDVAAKRTAEADIEPFVEGFLGELGPLLGSLLAPFRLPVIVGFQPYGVSVGDEGTAGAFLVVHALIRPAD